MKREGHPRLRYRWRKRQGNNYSHGFSEREVDSLSSICDALLPSLSYPPNPSSSSSSSSVTSFFKSSASQPPFPHEVAEVVKKRAAPEAVFLVRAVLMILSTRVGTLLLCGSLCFVRKVPFITKFSHLPTHTREKILQNWSSSYFFILRVVFYFVKTICLLLFVSKVDEQTNTNPAWEAMDYKVEENTHLPNTTNRRPLEQGVIESLYESPTSLIQSLSEKGIKVTQDREKGLYKIQCDAVIIGSGCGGAVAAAILASSGQKVIVLEKGNYYTAPDYSLLEQPSMEELLVRGGMFSTIDGGVSLIAGTAVGGGSVVNWSASIKTPKEVLKEWAEIHRLSLFGSSQYTFAMEDVCKRIGVTENCKKESFQNQVLRRGCENLGLKVVKVPRNSSESHYCGSCQYGCRSADKKGADLTWLVDAVESGCVVISGCKAEKLLLIDNNNTNKKKKCVGVMAKSLNENITSMIHIDAKVTISACGALLTPPLLISSGLRNKHIGRNLHLHPAMMLWGYFPESDSEFEGKMYEGGLITSAHEVKESEDGSVRALLETPALGPSSFAAISPWESGFQVKERLRKYSRTSHIFSMIRDEGSGEVKTEEKVSFRMSDVDKENMTIGVRRALRILVAAGAEEVGTCRSDGQRIKSKGIKEEDLDEFLGSVCAVEGPFYARRWGVYGSAHQMGSCRMGVSEDEGAVDGNGESWEAEGLFVCDGSVLPSAVGVNPMITIQSTAYCIAKKLAESLKKGEFSPRGLESDS